MAVRTTRKKEEPFTEDSVSHTPVTVAAPQNPFVPFLVILLIVVAYLLGMLTTKVQYLEQQKNGGTQAVAQNQPGSPSGTQPQGPTPTPGKVNVEAGHFPVKGNKDAKVSIIEFADFRCPFCEKLYTDVEPQLMKEYVDSGKAKFSFRHYAFLGPASTLASNAAECANEQGKFWDYYDYLYKNQPSESDTSMYTVDSLTNIAGTLGLDTTQFNECLSANKYDKNVSDDLAAGQKAGVSGTPTVFINGTPVVGAQPYSAFKTLIDQELAKNK